MAAKNGRKQFWGKFASKLHSMRVKNFVEITLSHTVSAIKPFLRSTQKFNMAAKNENSPVYSADSQRVKNFVKIVLSCNVSERNVFLRFTQKFKMAAKKWRENNFWEKLPVASPNSLGAKNFGEIALSCTVSEIVQIFLHFCLYADIQDGCHIWRENNFWEKLPIDSADTPWVKNFVEIALSCTVSVIVQIFHFQH